MATKVVLPCFRLTKTCSEAEPGATRHAGFHAVGQASLSYYSKPVADSHSAEVNSTNTWVRQEFNWFPLILDSHGQPWDVAIIYILTRLQSVVAPNMATYQGIAEDLSAFLTFIEDSAIDFTEFPQNKLKRPTYRFHGYLKTLVFDAQIAASTAKRRMSTVIAFYRWLVADGLLEPAHPLWLERDHYLSFRNAKGFSVNKVVKTTDITIRVPKQTDIYEGTIDDGGKLRPLSRQEQKWLVAALVSLNNVEMLLIHILLLATGARIQTALTLRVRHVKKTLPASVKEARLPVGPGTGVDTKNNKKFSLHIPAWLYEKLQIYSLSQRAILRREKTSLGSDEEQYLFLTQQGSPYYQNKDETTKFNPELSVRHQKRGQTIRTFIAERVTPLVRKNFSASFQYRLHDLRATYGMNLTDLQLDRVERGEITLAQARDFVKTRMGHENSSTTDLYLDNRRHLNIVYEAVDAHEKYFRELIDKAWAGFDEQ